MFTFSVNRAPLHTLPQPRPVWNTSLLLISGATIKERLLELKHLIITVSQIIKMASEWQMGGERKMGMGWT